VNRGNKKGMKKASKSVQNRKHRRVRKLQVFTAPRVELEL